MANMAKPRQVELILHGEEGYVKRFLTSKTTEEISDAAYADAEKRLEGVDSATAKAEEKLAKQQDTQ